MADLSAHDFRAVLTSAAALAEVGDRAALPAVALAEISGLIHCESASYNRIELNGSPPLVVSDRPEEVTADGLAEFGRLASQNPLISYYVESGDGAPVMFSDFISRRQLHRLEIHAALYRNLRIEHQLACALSSGSAVVGLALNRERRDFDERDREVLALLRPHLAACLRRIEAAAPAAGTAGRLAELTPREREVAAMAGRGMSNPEIALALMISAKTVNAHLERVYRKLGVHRRAQLATLLATDGR
ncbi:MAG TPA: helix-turn-helix transcriptional regulator [Solirubrobacterales bacterium]|nr:helix-turn-helix transcriptional regulator [Solirubrobacterales bacterium]